RLQGAASARQYKFLDIHAETEVIQVTAVQAGQHRHREHLQLALVLAGGFHACLVAVNGCEARAALRELTDGRAHGCRHIKELQIDKNLPVLCDQLFEKLEVAVVHEKLHADLVEPYRVAKLLDE